MLLLIAASGGLAALWLAGGHSQIAVPDTQQNATPFPGLRALDDNGQPINIEAALPGHPTLLLTFWASWCTTCMAELPAKIALAQQHPNTLALVAVSLDTDHPARVQAQGKLLERPAANVLWLHNADDTQLRALGVRGVPETYLLDEQRQILHKFTGPASLVHGTLGRILKFRLRAEPA